MSSEDVVFAPDVLENLLFLRPSDKRIQIQCKRKLHDVFENRFETEESREGDIRKDYDYEKHELKNPRTTAFKNIEQSCYFATAAQAFRHTSVLRQYARLKKNTPLHKILEIASMQGDHVKPVELGQMYKEAYEKNSVYNEKFGNQCDAVQLFFDFIKSVEPKEKDVGRVDFCMQTCSFEEIRTTYKKENGVSLMNPNTKIRTVPSIYTVWNAAFVARYLRKIPEYNIEVIDRKLKNSEWKGEEESKIVYFPNFLFMKREIEYISDPIKYISDPTPFEEEMNLCGRRYKIYGIIHRAGDNQGKFGHYVFYLKENDFENKWTIFDDDRVEDVDGFTLTSNAEKMLLALYRDVNNTTTFAWNFIDES